jgi:uncharacterized protein YfkK (UPF0435 family)
LTNRELSHISIIKNIDQQEEEVEQEVVAVDQKVAIVNESLIKEEPSEALALKEFINNILDNMNSNDNVLPDAKELQKAVLGMKNRLLS